MGIHIPSKMGIHSWSYELSFAKEPSHWRSSSTSWAWTAGCVTTAAPWRFPRRRRCCAAWPGSCSEASARRRRPGVAPCCERWPAACWRCALGKGWKGWKGWKGLKVGSKVFFLCLLGMGEQLIGVQVEGVWQMPGSKIVIADSILL